MKGAATCLSPSAPQGAAKFYFILWDGFQKQESLKSLDRTKTLRTGVEWSTADRISLHRWDPGDGSSLLCPHQRSSGEHLETHGESHE